MKKIYLNTGISTPILIGFDIMNLNDYSLDSNSIIITDKNIELNYRNFFPDLPVIVIETGEKIKTLSTIEYIIDQLIVLKADRQTTLIGIGGGIVCDICGFTASIYMRGIKFGLVPTSLLAQADAAIGGKNGVNFNGLKNIIGCFNQASFITIDPNFLKTLAHKELCNGFAEIIKSAFIGSRALFEKLDLMQKDQINYNEIIYDSVQIKVDIVEADEKESGVRKYLNFGHTFAHALESVYKISHGEAVAAGMVIACKISVHIGLINDSILADLGNLLHKFDLPIDFHFDFNAIEHALSLDKKKEGQYINMILLEDIGKPIIKKFTMSEIKGIINDLR